MKVYCKYCAYLVYTEYSTACEHPGNRYRFMKEDWYARRLNYDIIENLHKKCPSEININNDCAWWEKRHWWNFYKRWF